MRHLIYNLIAFLIGFFVISTLISCNTDKYEGEGKQCFNNKTDHLVSVYVDDDYLFDIYPDGQKCEYFEVGNYDYYVLDENDNRFIHSSFYVDEEDYDNDDIEIED